MSEMPPERAPAKRENVLTHRLGPMPTWAWIAALGAVIIAWAYWRNRQASNASAANSSATGTSAADVPQFVNQTYTTVTAPPAPTSVSVTVPQGDTEPPPSHTPPSPKTPASRPGGSQQPPIFNATYTVLKGETLASVAKKFKISRVELAHANGLGTGAGLRTGQKLKVPSPAPGGTPNKAI